MLGGVPALVQSCVEYAPEGSFADPLECAWQHRTFGRVDPRLEEFQSPLHVGGGRHIFERKLAECVGQLQGFHYSPPAEKRGSRTMRQFWLHETLQEGSLSRPLHCIELVPR